MKADKTISIVGLGPGNLKYLLPICREKIEDAELLVGGRRHIESLGEMAAGKDVLYIEGGLKKAIEGIEEYPGRVSLVVSGDTGFYSMLEYMKKNFPAENLATYPGISSIQYLFARCNLSWFDALLKSVHGREFDFEKVMKDYSYLGLLTDGKNTPQEIGRRLRDAGYGDKMIVVGENLSYEDEIIGRYRAEDLVHVERVFGINAVIVEGDRDGTY